MDTSKQNKVVLSDLDTMKGLNLTLWCDDSEKVEQFKYLARRNLPKTNNWFHQSNCRDFQMFEFWTPKINQIITVGQWIAGQLGLPYEEHLSEKEYPTGTDVDTSTLSPFDESFHTYDEFMG